MDTLMRKSKVTLAILGGSKIMQSTGKISPVVFEKTFTAPITKVVTFKSRLELEND